MTAGAQMNVVKQIFTGGRNTGGDSRFLKQAKGLARSVFARPLGKFLVEFLAVLLAAGATRKLCRHGTTPWPINFAMLCHSSSLAQAMIIQASSPQQG